MSDSERPPVQAPSMYCRGCGYNLHGLDQNRCPECGRAFDPDDPDTFVTARRQRHTSYVLRPAAVVVVTVIGVITGMAVSGLFPNQGRGSPTMLIFVPVLVFLGNTFLQVLLGITSRELWISGVAVQVLIWGTVSHFSGSPFWEPWNLNWLGLADVFILAPCVFGIVAGTAARGMCGRTHR